MTENINIEIEIDLDRELEKLEDEIETYNRMVETLIWQRSVLLTKKQDMDMYELIDCIIERGLTANEALEIINNVRSYKT